MKVRALELGHDGKQERKVGEEFDFPDDRIPGQWMEVEDKATGKWLRWDRVAKKLVDPAELVNARARRGRRVVVPVVPTPETPKTLAEIAREDANPKSLPEVLGVKGAGAKPKSGS